MIAAVDILTTGSTTGEASTLTVDTIISNEISSYGSTLTNSTQSTLTPVTIDGVSWKRETLVGDAPSNGSTSNRTFMIIGAQHPSDGLFAMVFQTDTANFVSTDALFFQPMLTSFKFK